MRKFSTWNQKNLDYEIETFRKFHCEFIEPVRLKSKEPRLRDWNQDKQRDWKKIRWLEIKRTSITRLKLKIYSAETILRLLFSWNQKNLDYEIETDSDAHLTALSPTHLKSKEPRLRDWNFAYPSEAVPSLVSWNQKNLDYEIETTCLWPVRCSLSGLKSKEPRLRDWNAKMGCAPCQYEYYETWNQKNLDYEIETNFLHLMGTQPTGSLKSKEPRLRDWNPLEPGQYASMDASWNQKNLDYEIETS